MSALVYFATGIIFTFFIPGFVITETFFGNLKNFFKLPLYILLSLISSTYLIYFVSLVIGFNRFSILLSFVFFAIWLSILIIRKNIINFNLRKHKNVLIFASLTFVIYLFALFPAIFTIHNGYIVMAAENWQDTAMHMSIIENLAQGNFPPQAPYFSGHPLSYYYFINLHSAILVTLVGNFFPRVLVYTNPLFIAFFIFAVYGLSLQITKSRRTSLIASFLAAFYGNLMSVVFLQDLGQDSVKELIASKGYTIEYGKLLTVSPMADYFLQNRPMMIGLPAFAVIISLILYAFKNKNRKLFLLLGLIISAFVKFQLFVILGSVLALVLLGLLSIRKNNLKFLFQSVIFFGLGILPGFIAAFLSQSGNSSLLQLIKQTWSAPWSSGQSILWHLQFIFANFGFHLILFLITLLLLILKKIKFNFSVRYIFLLGILLFIIPFFLCFTIANADMFKFFHLAIIPSSVFTAIGANWFFKSNKFLKTLIIIFLAISSVTCFLNLGWSLFNKNQAYFVDEYTAGMWVRENTPQNSVFVAMPTVHSAVSDIGGRPRVMSYMTWPYTHGFNTGEDNVFSRRDDVEALYKAINPEEVLRISKKYNAKYIYYGHEEKSFAPYAGQFLDSLNFLKKVYNLPDIAIYEVF